MSASALSRTPTILTMFPGSSVIALIAVSVGIGMVISVIIGDWAGGKPLSDNAAVVWCLWIIAVFIIAMTYVCRH